MPGLQGVTVLVTRPREQAKDLCELIRSAGGRAVPFPALEIEPLPRPARPDAACDIVIFVSPNAVRFGTGLLSELMTGHDSPMIGAIGPTTAKDLVSAGYPVTLDPGPGFTSEALLSAPELGSLQGKKILIVRGVGGREHLARELTRRGAAVSYAEVYKRVKPVPDQRTIESVESRWNDNGIDIVAANSVETLGNLYDILTTAGRRCLQRTPLVTASPRVADCAVALGLEGGVWMADAPDDRGIVEAISAWKSHQRGR